MLVHIPKHKSLCGVAHLSPMDVADATFLGLSLKFRAKVKINECPCASLFRWLWLDEANNLKSFTASRATGECPLLSQRNLVNLTLVCENSVQWVNTLPASDCCTLAMIRVPSRTWHRVSSSCSSRIPRLIYHLKIIFKILYL